MNSKHINQYKCEVCDSPLSRLEQIVQKNQDHLVCYFPDCKVVIRNKTIMDPTLFKLYLNVQKKTISKRKGEIAAKNAYASEICQKEMIEDQEILQSTLKNDPLLSKDKISVLTIPSAPTTLRQITDERIKNYTAHLKDVISEASKHANASEVSYDQHRYAHEGFLKVENNLTENTALRERSDRLCGVCKGGCCPEGRDKAFVSVITVRRYMDSHHELTGDDILEMYLSYISSEAIIDGSCINQTPTGCTLPREIRSDICNGYYCEPLKSYQKECTEKKEIGPVLAIQRSNTNWTRFDPDTCNEVISVTVLK